MKKFFAAAVVLGIVSAGFCPAADFNEGSLRLILDEKNGRFSLYYSSPDSRTGYVPFFSDKDPRTSFLQAVYNGNVYTLGDAPLFATWTNTNSRNPGFIFGSYFLRVTQDFTFIRNAGPQAAGGVSMRITLENLSPQDAEVGIRFLLDTNLGEGDPLPFFVDSRSVSAETMIEKGRAAAWWLTRKENLFFTGSIFLSENNGPDSIIFANWKRLNDAPWRFPYVRARSFNVLPFYVNDSAICYYYEPRLLKTRESVSYTIVLAGGDQNASKTGPISASDLELIQALIDRIDALSARGNANDYEINALEDALNELLRKYDLIP